MSFALTTPQILNRTKWVTRRFGWKHLKRNDVLQAVQKGQGLKKGEKVNRLAIIRIVSVRPEPLVVLVNYPAYGQREMIAEGFPEMSPREFMSMFCRANGCVVESDVTRIEFEFVKDPVSQEAMRP